MAKRKTQDTDDSTTEHENNNTTIPDEDLPF